MIFSFSVNFASDLPDSSRQLVQAALERPGLRGLPHTSV
jgi:hypothetical protein